ncbi:endonuclease/exonuclease/phosphatase family protein [Alienimonas californiensis]|uniref:Endonuclease/Exonuclease/phosphatase family protein n=1 Tax=Alienimonas californiensis TaxID=2527989 RepID=A0A517P5Z3_9PLAN|nr:endonuclease/exonuclease/phosphatase family protein [Alienimonas californiensis]QDT14794.1 Endonuclease/Exonuclease/phosphatase family protein [Alienimonas californiensis]
MRILSYNIHKGIGGRDRRYRLERIKAVVAAADPDVLCLQEVDRNVRRTRFDDQPRLLAEWFLGRHLPHIGPHPHTEPHSYGDSLARVEPGGEPRPGAVFQMNHALTTGRTLPGGPHRGGYGNLIVSKRPILEAHTVDLTRGRRKKRGAVVALLETEAGPLRLVNWHLGLLDGERQWQVRRLLSHELFEAVGQCVGGALPTLLIGDTNDWRSTLMRGGLGDAGYQLLTNPARQFRSFPAWLPTAALDRAFGLGLPGEGVTATVCGGPGHPLGSPDAAHADASDHLPLIVDLPG